MAGMLISAGTLSALLLLLEVAYRYQWVDFYGYELAMLNKPATLSDKTQKVLVLGDSFSASNGSYVAMLNDSLSGYAVVNSAIPGTSMREMSFIAKNRIDRFKPDLLLLQVYPGNDLLDISHPRNTQSISWFRNLYWFSVDRCAWLGWLNYKLAGLRKVIDTEQHFVIPKAGDTFSVDGYSSRVKLLIKADSSFIANSNNVTEGRYSAAFEKMIGYMHTVTEYYKSVKPDGKIVVIVMPHCSSVSEIYYNNYLRMGGALSGFKNGPTEFTQRLARQLPDASVVDVTDALITKEQLGERTYYMNDEHLTPVGQKVVADSLTRVLLPVLSAH
jgi:hypothetical protein